MGASRRIRSMKRSMLLAGLGVVASQVLAGVGDPQTFYVEYEAL
jgi:hypothetical protein